MRALEIKDTFQALPLVSDWAQPETNDELNLTDIENSLNSLMWRNVGIRRDEQGLTQAASQLEFWDRYVSRREFDQPKGWELQNQLLIARLMVAAAIERKESRGVHLRIDYPDADSQQAEHIAILPNARMD